MSARVAINGFGRIGRAFLRSAIERNAELDVVAVHDVAGADVLAHLLERDSIYGRFAHPVRVEDGALVVADRRIKVVENEDRRPSWGELGADVVIEATGRLRTRTDAARHIDAGARKVIVSAPIKGPEQADADLVLGVNFDEVYDPERHHIVSNVSCTTNCLAPVAKVLHETVGIRHGLMTTIHAYTADQQLLDATHKDLRRARAAAINLVPTSTGAAKAIGLVIPELEGRLNGFAVRVPVPTGSLVDLTVETEHATTADEINAAFAERATSGTLGECLQRRRPSRRPPDADRPAGDRCLTPSASGPVAVGRLVGRDEATCRSARRVRRGRRRTATVGTDRLARFAEQDASVRALGLPDLGRKESDMTTDTIADADTVVLIHGLWMTPRSWERWIPRYEHRGYRVIAPAYPGFEVEVEVEALRDDPAPIEAVTVPDTLEHLEGIVSELENPPILIGHSFGGALVQMLLDRGLGAAGIAIDSVPTEGVRTLPASQIRATFPVLHNPANRHRAVAFTPKQFHYAFTNTLSEDESVAVYERYHVPAPGRWVWDGVLANVTPGHQATWVNYRNDDRAPLLFIAGGKDHIMPAAVNKDNAERYEKSAAHTDYYEFAGRDHFTIGAPGWEKVADYARTWAVEHAPWTRRVLARRRSMAS